MAYDKIEGKKVPGNQFGNLFDKRQASPCWGDSLAVGSGKGLIVPVTLGTLDEIKRVNIAIEKSVEVVPLLVKRLGIAAASCGSA